jgi:hypothetical protein
MVVASQARKLVSPFSFLRRRMIRQQSQEASRFLGVHQSNNNTPENKTIMSQSQFDRIVALTQQPTEMEAKVKKRWTKKDKELRSLAAPLDAITPTETSQNRPGKKKMRKIRYQQKELSAFEFLIASAESAQFTGSVLIKHTEKSSPEQTFPIAPCEIAVLTSSTTDDHHQQHLPALSKRQHLIQVKPLIVLDLNGILCHRVRRSRDTYDPLATYRPSIGTVANTPILPRPHVFEFLHFLQQHFTLAVWTSAKKKTADKLINLLVPKKVADSFLFVWAQHDCKIQPQIIVGGDPNDQLFEKDLSKVWVAYPLWNVHNTLLMDDSPEKCTAVKQNAIHPPPLNGRIRHSTHHHHHHHHHHHSNAAAAGLVSDEENVAQQFAFMEQLARHWVEHPLVQEWDEEGGDIVYGTTKTQTEFLKEHGSQYKVW